jgi:hypothetical protein
MKTVYEEFVDTTNMIKYATDLYKFNFLNLETYYKLIENEIEYLREVEKENLRKDFNLKIEDKDLSIAMKNDAMQIEGFLKEKK